MNGALLLSLIGLGAVDSLNPFSIAAQAYLLGTQKPGPRAWAFLFGSFATYLLGGIFLVQGILVVVQSLLHLVPDWVFVSGRLALGAASIALAIYLWRRSSQGAAFTPPSDLSVRATVVFAVGSTVSDLPTAVPYFAAAGQIASATTSFWDQLGWLTIYNAVYVGPLLLLVTLHYILGARSEALFGRIQAGVNWAFARLLPPLILLLGVWLIFGAGG